MTPRDAADAPESPARQQVKAPNRNLLSNVASLLSEGSVLSDAGHASSKATPRPGASARGRQQAPATSRREYEAARRQREYAERHRLLQLAREDDEKRIQERLERMAHAREAKFEALVEGIHREDPLRLEVSEAIREHEAELSARRRKLLDGWDAVAAHRARPRPARSSSAAPAQADVSHGQEEAPRRAEQPGALTGALAGALTSRARVHPGARDLHERHAEERFHRAAALALAPTPRGEASERELQRRLDDAAAARRGRARPTLEVEAWGPGQRLASPHGHFARTEPGSSSIHSARRMGTGAHGIDESDGVPAAGKSRNRFQRNLLGMLEGSLAREGEAVRHRRAHGAGSGAPCQDHFLYEQGNAIIDAEFPVGKRSFAHLMA